LGGHQRASARKHKEALKRGMSRLNILHLEDDIADVQLAREMLEGGGIISNATRVETESSFVAAVKQGGFDLILADYALPSFDGLSALKIARRQCPDLPFIFVSGTMGEELAIDALKLGATDYVLKTGLSRLAPAVQRAVREAKEIAERRKAEEALCRSERELREVIESIPAMVWMALPDSSNVLMNKRWERYTGLSGAGLGWQAAVHPDDLERHMEAFRACSAAGVPFEDEVRFRRADGQYRWFLVQGTPLRDENGKVVKWYGVVTDIEDRKHAEEALRESEQELRNVIATIPTFAWTALPDGYVDFANRYWQEYTGLSVEETQGSGWRVAVHRDDVEVHGERWGAALANGGPFEGEVRYRRAADGQYHWFLTRAVPLRDEQGKILKWYGISTDIDDRRRVEAFLAGEKRILEMVAKGDSLSAILDALCRFVEEQASDVLASIFLLDGDRLRHGGAPNLPKAYADAIDGIVIGPSAGSCGTAAYRGEVVIVEDIATDPSWADYRDLALPHGLRACWSTPIFSSQGKVIAAFAMYYREPRRPSHRDQQIIEQITHLAGVAIERKLIQEALRRSEAYLAEAQRLTHTGSWAYSPVRKSTVYWSEEMFRIIGFDPRQSIPTDEEFLERVHPEDREKFLEGSECAVQEKRDSLVDYRVLLPGGTVKYIQSSGHPVFDANGEILEYVGTAVDMTDRKHAEEERDKLRQLEAELVHINRVSMMGELAASLSHELKQPITAAITNAKTGLRWIERDQPDWKEARESTLRVVSDGMRAAEIIDRLRSLYKKSPPQRELIDVNEIAREMVVLLRSEANKYSIAMRTEVAVGLPKICADRVQLQQVLMNLMLNAIEAMRDIAGELIIRAELGQDGQLLVSVSDTGIGLPGENTEQIFSAFYTTKPQGSGMGLAISRSIIESHGGHLWASRNSKRGAKFQFTLPTEPKASSSAA
jgi:PAS domain S-box-containing protein